MTAREHGFIAGPFTLFDHLPADPPHGGMEPEQRLDQPMHRVLQIVVTRDVFVFVSQHRVHFRLRESPEQRGRQQHHRMKNARHGRFNVGIRDACIR